MQWCVRREPYVGFLVLFVFASLTAVADQTELQPLQQKGSSDSGAAMVYSRLLSHPTDRINAVAAGTDGSVYVAGVTLSHVMPVDLAKRNAGEGKPFVARLSPDGSKIAYFTYLDASYLSEARGIAVDASGNAYVTGETWATSFPTFHGLQSTCSVDSAKRCEGDAFVAKVGPQGSLVFSTYFGGSGEDAGNAIAVDSRGNIYVTGSTTSQDLPILNAWQDVLAGSRNAFIAKIAGDGSHVIYATYLGGKESDQADGIAVDAAGNAYVAGETQSTDFPTKNALQYACVLAHGICAGEAFVTKLSADGSAVLYSTYLGGSGGDSASAIAVDRQGRAYVAGVTASSDFPAVKAVQSRLAGGTDGFVSELGSDGGKLLFSSYLGGAGSDYARAIALDSSGNVFVSGWTSSTDFPTRNPIQAFCNSVGRGCSTDAFLAVLDGQTFNLHSATYLGGSGVDVSPTIAVDAQSQAYLAGWTTSTDFPEVTPQESNDSTKTNASVEPASGGFVAKLAGLVSAPSTVNCFSGTNNWTGSAGDNQWTTASNWSLNRVPNSGDTACIASTFSGRTITIGSLATNNQNISGIISGAPIAFTAGPLTVNGTVQTNSDFNISSGVLSITGFSGFSTLELSNGTLTGAGGITATGPITWSGGQICSIYSPQTQTCNPSSTLAPVNANAGLTISGSVTLNGRALNNSQTATVTGAVTVTMTDSVITNMTGGTWSLAANATFNSSGTGPFSPTFNNSGTFNKTGGTGTSTFAPNFNNSGAVAVNAGTLDLTGNGVCGSVCSGSWTVASGATLQFDTGEFSLSGPIGGTGAAGAGTVTFSSGLDNLSGSYNITGATNVLAATTNFTGTITNVGAISVTTGVANLANTNVTTLTVPTMTLGGGTLSAPDNFTITGLLNWSGGNMCTAYSSTTSACMAPTTQAVTTAKGGIQFGTGIPALDGRTLNNVKTATATASNFWSLNLLDSAIVNNNAGATFNLAADASIDGFTGTFNNMGTFEKTAGSSTSVVEAVFNNTGIVAANAAILNFVGGGSCSGTCGGSWSVASGATLQFDTGTFTLSGKIGGAGTLTFSSGTEALTGTLSLTGNTNFSGAVVDFNQTGSVTFSGPVNLTNGYVSGPAILNFNGLLTWTYGVLCTVYSSAALQCAAPQTMAVANANGGIAIGSAYPTLDGRVLNNAQTMTMSGAGFFLNLLDSAVVNNRAGATWNLSADAGVNGSTGTFNNMGIFEKSSGTGTSTIQVVFNNKGQVIANAALLDFTGGGTCGSTCAGSWTVTSGATVEFDNGAFALSGAISGAGTVQFGSGTETLTGSYTLTGPTAFTGGVVAFNQSSAVNLAGTTSLTGGVVYGTAALTFNGAATWTYASLCTTYSTSTSACVAPQTQSEATADGGITFGAGNGVLDGRTLNNKQTIAMTSKGNYINLLDRAIVNNNTGAIWNFTADANIDGSTGTFNNSGTFKKTGGTGTTSIQPVFSNSGTVAANSGTLSFAAAFSQTGGTTSLGGGSLSLSSPATYSGGSLTGTGAISGSVVNSAATIAPGTPTVVGTVTFASSSSNYTQNASGTMTIKIGGTGSTQYDQVVVGGAATLGGTLKITLINGFSPVKGDTFTIVRAGSVQGQFSTIPKNFTATYNKTSVVLTYQ